MENHNPGLTLGNQIREALALAGIAIFLIVLSYLITAFIMQVLPFPFGSLDDFSLCCSGLQANPDSMIY
jgi:hypothetical protein